MMIECDFYPLVGENDCIVRVPAGSIVKSVTMMIGLPLRMHVIADCPEPKDFEVAGIAFNATIHPTAR